MRINLQGFLIAAQRRAVRLPPHIVVSDLNRLPCGLRAMTVLRLLVFRLRRALVLSRQHSSHEQEGSG
jgi:hypothetical protein